MPVTALPNSGLVISYLAFSSLPRIHFGLSLLDVVKRLLWQEAALGHRVGLGG